MSFYSLKVASIKDAVLVADVWITEPQQQFFHEEPNVALQLIWDGLSLQERKNSPLGKEVSQDQILDSEWVLAHEAAYINSVAISGTSNYPLSAENLALTGKDAEKFWQDRKRMPHATYEIVVTDPAWLEHLKKGKEWTSSALNYEMM